MLKQLKTAIMPGKTVLAEAVVAQRVYFSAGNTHPLAGRKKYLRLLREVLRENEQEIAEAVYRDFGKSWFEVRSNELGLVYAEIRKAVRRLRRWSAPERRRTSLVNLPGQSRVYPVPYGSVLVIGPWNYPVQLALIPVVSAIAAGNTVILKPSEITGHTSGLLARLLNEAFPEGLLHVVEGGVDETQELLGQRFDKIFFTGSTRVGRIVMKAAAENLTPVTLELGGKNPVVVMPDCNLKMTAKRLVWGKFHNGGQACVAPDHIYVHRSIRDRLLAEVHRNIDLMFREDAANSEAYPKIVDRSHYERLMKLIDPGTVVSGGGGDPERLFIEPTIMTGVKEEDAIMKEEVFGPLMPFLEFDDLDELMEQLKQKPSPLCFYIFTSNLRLARKIQREFRSGGGMINDTVVHFVNDTTPFGGIGESGMGNYHGKAGFDCFSHPKTVLKKSTWFELPMKYPPYTRLKLKIIKAVLR